ncbi:MAG: DUF6152 family protein [Allosphingosinicella sp.]|uniref:DUF6152 family protein n=1 Tax=Allosphingosinicella sp. TaxID=2823234 RepID=UPI0039363797
MKKLALALALAVAVPTAAIAHHGWSSYDAEQVIEHQGTLTELSWGNPHGMAKVQFRGQIWDVVLAPTRRMEARGLTEAEIRPGQRITLVGYPRRDGTPEMRIERVIVGNKTVELR